MKLIHLSALFAILSVNTVYAITELGSCDIGKGAVNTVICYGPASLKETIVNGDVKIAGPLNAMRSSMESLIIAGNVDLEDCTIKGIADISGYLNAKGCSFEKNLSIKANTIKLNHSTIKGSLQITSARKKPYLKLECASTIVGAVNFSGQPGVIQMTGDSAITGHVTNALIEKIDTKCNPN